MAGSRGKADPPGREPRGPVSARLPATAEAIADAAEASRRPLRA
ncbi:hypothetical protein ACQZOG_25425 [Streptomyces sp. P13-3-3]